MKNNSNLINEVAKSTNVTTEQVVNSYKNVLERLNTELIKVKLDELDIIHENKTAAEVFEEVSKLYKSLGEDDQFELAKTLGGTYHLSKTKAIFDALSE